jgi:hypothetical protein
MKKLLGDPILAPIQYDECEAPSWHATEVVESFAVSKTLAESRIEVEVEGEAVATTITPAPTANTRSFFGGEVIELDRLAPVGGRSNKDDEGLLDTHSSDDDEGDFILQLPDYCFACPPSVKKLMVFCVCYFWSV